MDQTATESLKMDSEKKRRMITVSLPVKPEAKARPRFSKGKAFNSQKELEETMRWRIKSRLEGQQPLEGPLRVWVEFTFKRPKSNKEKYHFKRPDLDNLIKNICDVGNTIIWHDDAQIVEVSAKKIYGEKNEILLVAEEMKIK